MLRRLLPFVLILALVLPGGVMAQDDQVTLEFWHTYNETSPENQMLVETLIPMFEAEHPNINVESVPFPYNDFRQAMLTAMAGGEGPDLARLDIMWTPEFADLGALMQLDEAMPDFQEYADRVFPGPLSTNAYNDGYYGLPLDTNTRVYFYNQAMYDEAGITNPPATMEELSAQCDQVKEALGEEAYLYSDGGTYAWALLPWIWSFGGDITNPEITEASGYVNSEQSVAALEFLKDMIDRGCFTEGMLGSGYDTNAGYFGNEVASVLDGPWLYLIGEAQYPDFELKAALMPAGEGGSVSVVGGENIVVFNTSDHPEESLEFLRFTLSDEYQLKMSEVGQLTVLPALLENEYFQNHPYYGIFLQQLETAKARQPHPAFSQLETVLSDTGYLVLSGEMDAQEALDMAAEEMDAILAEYNE